jgi:hypothetical protein
MGIDGIEDLMRLDYHALLGSSGIAAG